VERPRCVHCGEIVGVYEPARLVLSDGANWSGSPLTFGDALDAHGAIVVHERCYADFERDRGQGRAEGTGRRRLLEP
jgi:hypothetical protein